jgi:glycosyltransferase involved in cell wall biosynthesis
MNVALLIPVLSDKDAVGTDVLAMRSLLEGQGHRVRIYCESSQSKTEKTYPASDVLGFAGRPGDLIIYHFSVGWPRAIQLLARARSRRVVKYHNITPPQFFAGIAADYEAACTQGRAEIEEIAALGCELYIGASAFNLRELVAAGVPPERGVVQPPFHRIEALRDTPADLALLDRLLDGRRNFLMVGRIAPNKGHVELVDAFASYTDAFADDGRLLIVGKIDKRLDAYLSAIRAKIDEHRLGGRVVWLDSASEAELKSAYLASRVLLTLSRHEGFCVPLVEAMALDLPIVAHASTAVPETVGPAGLCWDSTDPLLYAASAARIFADEAVRARLQDTGRARYAAEFADTVLRRRFLDELARFA